MGYKKPLEVKLQLTEKCNFDCNFCFNKQSSVKKASELPAGMAEAAISIAAEEGIKGIRFTGGEPLLYPKLFELLSFAREKGLSITLNTNASLIGEKEAKKLACYVDKLLVSMHSSALNTGSVAAVKLLADEGLFPKAATILTKENIQSLEVLHKAFSRLPFSQWVLLRQIPNALNPEPLSPSDMALATEKIESLNKGRKRKERFLIENAVPFCCFESNRVEKIALGGIHEDGHSGLFLNAEGKIKPSYFLGAELGNAGDSFLSAWKSDFMKRMNALEFIPEKCHSCKLVLKCMAGSRFSALFSKNSLYAFDPLALPEKFFPGEGETNK